MIPGKSLNRWTALFAILAAGVSVTARAEPPVPRDLLDWIRVIEDPEGSVNVRSGASLDSPVYRKLASGSVIGIGERRGDWYEVTDGSYNGAPEFIHATRLKEVSDWAQMPAAGRPGESKGYLKHRGFEVRASSAPFVSQDHEITELAEGLYEVDGAVPWGTDGGLPKRTLALSVSLNGVPVAMPKEAAEGLFEPNFETMVLLTPRDPSDDRALLFMSNSDGAGAYCVFWAFAEGRYQSRHVFREE